MSHLRLRVDVPVILITESNCPIIDVGKNLSKAYKFFDSEKAARRAAFRDAGIGKHGASIKAMEEYRPGSINSRGKAQKRKTWTSKDTGKKVAHDAYGHKNPVAGPHYNVYDKYGNSTHYYYPSKYNPLKNR